MEFLSVGGIKLKVILNAAECEQYGIDRLDGENPGEAERASIKSILAAASEEVSFFASGERLLIQLYPLGERGAELFITKLSAIPERERRTVTESGIMTYQGRHAVFRIADKSALVGVSRLLGDRAVDLYLATDGAYYLTLDECVIGDVSDCDRLTEFGERIHKLPLGIDTEWGRCLLSSLPLVTVFGE